jgi:hypothetical protein
MSRYFALLVPVCLAAGLAGCGPSKGDIDKSIKDEMKSGLGVDITSTNLTKQPDGGYTGTATAANGDIYDVVVNPSKGNKAEWKAAPAQPTVEKMLREMIDAQIKVKVQSMSLTKQGFGTYTGTAALENGKKLNLSATLDGKTLNLKADPAP